MTNYSAVLFLPQLGDLSDHLVLRLLPLAVLGLNSDDCSAELGYAISDGAGLSLKFYEVSQFLLRLKFLNGEPTGTHVGSGPLI